MRKRHLPGLVSTLLLVLINIYASDLYHWITGDYLPTIEKSVPYKLLLQICLGLASALLACLAFFLPSFKDHNRASRSTDSTSSRSSSSISQPEIYARHLKLLQNLSDEEKEFLRSKYMQPRIKSVLLSDHDRIALGLASQGILYNPISHSTIHGQTYFQIYEWAWDMLRHNTKLLK